MIYKSFTFEELSEAIDTVKKNVEDIEVCGLGKIHFGPLKREFHIYRGDGTARYDYDLDTKKFQAM